MSTLRVGIAGLGTVGANVARLLQQKAAATLLRAGRDITVTAVSVRDKTKDRGIDLNNIAWFDDPVEMAKSSYIDVFVELIGGEEGPALAAVRAALDSGKPVITANKALLARHGMELAALAEKNKTIIAFEAAVAGGIPVIKTLREALAGNDISRVSGILNGTCNYILSMMETQQRSFDECLHQAQILGYAEADPTFDIGGFDTAHKLSLLTSLAFGVRLDSEAIHIEGIQSITLADIKSADELGYRIKLLGVAERTETGIEQRVHPTMVPKTSAIAQVMGVTNAVSIDGDAVGTLTLVGPGAGGAATASAVLGDLVDIARGICAPAFGMATHELNILQRLPMQRHQGGYYIRLMVHDRPGAAASIASRMAQENISLESIVQRRPTREGATGITPVILMTYATSETHARQALDKIFSDGVLAETPQIIRMERD